MTNFLFLEGLTKIENGLGLGSKKFFAIFNLTFNDEYFKNRIRLGIYLMSTIDF